MIRVEFDRYFKERMWFGLYYDDEQGVCINSVHVGTAGWHYTNWWTLRLWPCLIEGTVVPRWWMSIFNYFGYALRDDGPDGEA